MNLRDLKYLVALAEHKHFRKASEACFVTQPALSIQIKKLEDTLGVQLLERTNKSVIFTDVGLTLVERARTILVNEAEMHDIAKGAKDPYGGELKLGIFPTLAPYLLPHIMPKLAKKYSKLKFYLIEEKTDILLEKLKAGQLDAAILALPIKEKKLTTLSLFIEEFLLAVPKQHVLTKKKYITAANLSNQTLLLLEEGHCMREQMLNFCKMASATENNNFRSTSLETLRNIIATGFGITLMPSLAMKAKDIIAYIPFKSPQPTRTIGLCFRNSTAKCTLLSKMAEQIKKIMHSQKNLRIT